MVRRRGIKCFAADGNVAVGVWMPQGNVVLVMVCKDHGEHAQAEGGKVRWFR